MKLIFPKLAMGEGNTHRVLNGNAAKVMGERNTHRVLNVNASNVMGEGNTHCVLDVNAAYRLVWLDYKVMAEGNIK